MRRGMAIGVLGCLLATTAACGSRATVEQRALARSVRASGSAAPGPGQAGDGAGTATTLAPAGAGSATDVSTPASSDGPQQPAGPTGTTLPAQCQNKGATDVGVTSSQITLGNVATLSGPVPGIFQGGQIGAQAVAAYQNSLGGICGRQIKLALRDDKFDSGQNRAQTIDLIDEVFGMVGSISLYDDAAAAEVGRSGMPDMDVAITTARQSLANNFAVAPQKPGGAPLGPFNYLKEKYPAAIKSVGALWADAGSSTQAIEQGAENAARSVGFNIVFSRGYTPTETDFTADVVRMRQNGVRTVMLMGADPKSIARITGSMAQQGFKPDVVFSGAQAYDQATVALGGGSVEGVQIFQTLSLYAGEDASIQEVALMNQWVQKVKPGFKVDLFAMYAWAEGRLLFRAMQGAGSGLTRANVVAQLGKIGQYDGNGLLAPANPSAKVPATCFLVATIKGGKFVRSAPPSGYICDKGGYYGR
jgi:ABC-type branched-subunit amino acid transport system substrate-binding protein